ncbi:MAG TPA: TetR/AcrR family transcriptional regulator [Devosia sp.]|nr:TetR/AcrR family transcriptional regulator [Devosia sp.]
MDVSPDKRERILQAASKLIVQNGLQCSMSAIAEEAGVATGSLYNYFKSKEDLVRGIYGRVAEAMTGRLVADHPGISQRDRIRRYIADYIDFIWEDPLRARLFEYLDNNPLITINEAGAIFGPFVDHSSAMLEAGQREGSVREGQVSLMASFVRGAIRNTLKRRRTDPAPLTEAERQGIAAMCWDAIAVHG